MFPQESQVGVYRLVRIAQGANLGVQVGIGQIQALAQHGNIRIGATAFFPSPPCFGWLIQQCVGIPKAT